MSRDKAFERLYAEHARDLLAFLVYRTADRQVAEDVLADTFERVLRSRRIPDRHTKAWLYTIALNRLRDLVRRDSAESRALFRAFDGAVDDVSPMDSVDERDELYRALSLLPDDEREALSLRYGGELSLKEIASVIGERQTTIEGRIYRGLRKLRAELKPGVPVPGS
jgi:RNA polymerase sigma-70 factor (ECF subfamily)